MPAQIASAQMTSDQMAHPMTISYSGQVGVFFPFGSPAGSQAQPSHDSGGGALLGGGAAQQPATRTQHRDDMPMPQRPPSDLSELLQRPPSDLLQQPPSDLLQRPPSDLLQRPPSDMMQGALDDVIASLGPLDTSFFDSMVNMDQWQDLFHGGCGSSEGRRCRFTLFLPSALLPAVGPERFTARHGARPHGGRSSGCAHPCAGYAVSNASSKEDRMPWRGVPTIGEEAADSAASGGAASPWRALRPSLPAVRRASFCMLAWLVNQLGMAAPRRLDRLPPPGAAERAKSRAPFSNVEFRRYRHSAFRRPIQMLGAVVSLHLLMLSFSTLFDWKWYPFSGGAISIDVWDFNAVMRIVRCHGPTVPTLAIWSVTYSERLWTTRNFEPLILLYILSLLFIYAFPWEQVIHGPQALACVDAAAPTLSDEEANTTVWGRERAWLSFGVSASSDHRPLLSPPLERLLRSSIEVQMQNCVVQNLIIFGLTVISPLPALLTWLLLVFFIVCKVAAPVDVPLFAGRPRLPRLLCGRASAVGDHAGHPAAHCAAARRRSPPLPPQLV